MDSHQSDIPNTHRATSASPDSQNPAPHGPQPTRRWECPARYVTNHKHEDGRPLCHYCECWNPAPFPNGSLPIQAASRTTTSLPTIVMPSFQSESHPFPITQPSFPPDITSIYSSYNLSPPPESHHSQSAVGNRLLVPQAGSGTYHHLLQQLSFPSTSQNLQNPLARFPSLKNDSAIVEQTRLLLKPRPKSRMPHHPANAFATMDLPTISKQPPSSHSTSRRPRSIQEVQTNEIPQWQLQIICGPGHNHNDFASQWPGTKFKCRVGTTHCRLRKARRNSVEVSGGRLARLLRGHSSPRADGRATCTYRPPIDPPEPRTSLLATTRIHVFKLATARVFCFVLLATTSVLSCLPSTLYRLFCSP